MKISPAILVALVGAAAVFFFMQRRAQAATVADPRQTASGTWQYPAGSLPGPTPTTYRDPEGAVLFKPDYTGPVDYT